MDISSQWDAYCEMREEWMEVFKEECKKLGYLLKIDESKIESTLFLEQQKPEESARKFINLQNP